MTTYKPFNAQEIAQEIQNKGFVITDSIISQELGRSLLQEFQNTPIDGFKNAGIGRQKDFSINADIRTDQIYWLKNDTFALREYHGLLEEIRLAINQTMYLGLFDFECHFAHYPTGSFYKKHIDAFKGSSVRVLSSILYLNPDWKLGDGGELIIYSSQGDSILETITPTFCKQIFFLSQEFPHEVLTTNKPRQSLTGWFRINDFTTP